MSAPSPKSLSPFSKTAILFHTSTIFYWASVYVYIPILAAYAQEVGGSLQAAGLVMGAYGIPQILFRIPLGVWSDRPRRRKPFILVGFLFDLLASIGLAFSPSTWMLFLSFFGAGIAASMWVVFTVLFTSYFSVHQVTQSLSLLLVSSRLSQMASNYVGGTIAEAWGWVAPFYAGAVFSIIGLVLSRNIMEARPIDRPPMSLKDLLAVGREPQLLTVSFLAALVQFVIFSTIFGFTPIYAQKIGASKADLGLLPFSFMLPYTLAMLACGMYAIRWVREKSLIAAGLLLMGIATFSAPYTHSLGVLCAIQMVNGIGMGMSFPFLMSLAIRPIPREQQATAMGFFQSLYAIGMSLGPVISGWMGDQLGLSSVFFLSGMFCLAAALIAWAKVQRTG